MSFSTDAMYNAKSRYLHKKLIIYFSATNTLDVLTSNYLIDSDTYEEAYKATDSPFGDVSSNELSFSLYNNDGLFNPENPSSPYYKLIRKGVKVESFIRPDEATEWDKTGTFYVTNWTTSSNGLIADVTANDSLYDVLNGPMPSMPVYRNVSLEDFLKVYFGYFNLEVRVDSAVNISIPYVYTSDYTTNKDFLTDLMKGVMADCFCNHDGKIVVFGKMSSRAIRAKLTDDDQIVSVSIQHSIVNNYDSAIVKCNKGQESSEKSLISVSDLRVMPGTTTSEKFTVSSRPVLSVKSVCVSSIEDVTIPDFVATASEFECTLQSAIEVDAKLDVIGTTLDTVVSTVGEGLSAPLTIDSRFVQNETMAKNVLTFAKKYVEANVPTLELTVRGNPKLQLGDLLEIESQYYKVHYYGVIIKADYKYQGNLTCTLVLADAFNLLEV